MKMRRMRVRSLLAGCISCLRCARTSALTCRSSPRCVPPRSSRLLSARCASLFSLFFRSPEQLISSAARQQQKYAFQGIFSVHIGAGSLLPLPSPLLAAALIYCCDGPSWTSGSRHANQPSRPLHACEPAPWCCQNFACPPSKMLWTLSTENK